MNDVRQRSIQETIKKLQQHGFNECTRAANRDNETEYLCAFERLGEKKQVYYCCTTVDDLFALWSLVEASISQRDPVDTPEE